MSIGDVIAPIIAKNIPKIPHTFESSFINEKIPKRSAIGDNMKLIKKIPINPITKLNNTSFIFKFIS